jgi:pentatricopeptide repeat protein
MLPDGYQKAFQVVKQLRSSPKWRLDIAIYNSLLTGIVGMKFEDIQRERDIIFALLKKDRLTPDAKTYTTIIDAVVKQKIEGSLDFGRLPEEQLDWCYTLIEESQNLNVTPEPSMYTSLIKGCVKSHDPVRAWKSFDHMRIWNCQPDVVLYTEMLHVCSASGEAEKALDLFDELKQVDLYPTEVTFNALLSCFRKRPDMTKNMLQILQEMKEAGYKPDLKTFRHLIEGIQDGGDYVTANLLFDEISAHPEVDHQKLHWAYRALFWTYSKGAMNVIHKVKCVELTEAAFDRFLTQGLTPTTEILNSVLAVYCTAPRIHRALEIREQFTELGLVPTKATYYHLIAMFSHIRRMERAFDIFNQMKLANIQPTLYVYGIMIAGCAKTHYVMSGMRLIREMKEKGIALLPHHRHIMNFRRNLMQTPHLIREIDRLTGKDLEFVPGWKKVGGRHQRPDWRNVSKKERKDIAASPVLLPSSKYASGQRD